MTQIKELISFFMMLVVTAKASQVTFEATPSVVLENLTKSSSMRCSTNNNASETNIRQVTSISVTSAGNHDVATVTGTDAPAALSDLGNLQAKGSVSGQGYLELSWADPSNMTLGTYTCTIAAIDTNGQKVTLAGELLMTSKAPSMMDWINDLNSKVQTQQQENQKQQQQITQQQQIIETLQQKLQACSNNVAFMAAISTSRFVVNRFTVSSGQRVVYDATLLNSGGNYDNSTGAFTCVVPGVYTFDAHAMNSDNNAISLSMKLNTASIASLFAGHTDKYESDSVSAVIHLDVGDVVRMVTTQTSTFHDESSHHDSNIFSGHLVTADGCHP